MDATYSQFDDESAWPSLLDGFVEFERAAGDGDAMQD